MSEMKRDKNGVPVLSRRELESRTEGFLGRYFPECLEEPRFTPIAELATILGDTSDLRYVFGQDLGVTENGKKIRGSFHLPSRTISIDISLEPGSPPFNFTLAHEIGHFLMHRNVDLVALQLGKDTIEDGDRDLVLDHQSGGDPRSWLEWQANKFAASILLPLATFNTAITQQQIKMGIARNIGTVYRYPTKESLRDFDALMKPLIVIYQTSWSAIRLRMRELNILCEVKNMHNSSDSENEGFKHILDAFRPPYDLK